MPELGRLRTRPEFLKVASRGRKCAMPGLVLQAWRRERAGDVDSEAAGLVRVGFTASRKVGKAVARNRAKRRLRALARARLAQRGEPGTDYVLIARAATVNRPFERLVDDLDSALSRVAKKAGERARPATPRPARGERKANEEAKGR